MFDIFPEFYNECPTNMELDIKSFHVKLEAGNLRSGQYETAETLLIVALNCGAFVTIEIDGKVF